MTKGNKFRCYYCGQSEQCTKDHFIPASVGGFLTVWACQVCQGSKKNLMPEEWLQYLDRHVMIDRITLQRVQEAVNSLWNKIQNKEIPAIRSTHRSRLEKIKL